MPRLDVYDPAMCCPTGVCGPAVDPQLARFSADLAWLGTVGVEVRRYNLAQEPAAFAGNAAVKEALAADGPACLPLLILDGRIVARASYPSRAALGELVGVRPQARRDLPAPGEAPCCGGKKCC